MNKIKVGMVGLGSIVEVAHLPALAKREDITITAACDLNVKRLNQLAKNYGIPNKYVNGIEMIENEDLDAVVICTPNSTHIEYARAAAEKGIHIFIEKPIGVNIQEVKQMLELAKRNQAIVMVGMVNRFRRDIQIAKEYIDSGLLGDIYFVKAQLLRRRGTPKGWFTNRSLSGGGVMMDIGVHILDATWWLLGCPKPVAISGYTIQAMANYETRFLSSWESSSGNKDPFHNVEDFAAGWIRFEKGLVLSLETSWALNGKQNEDISIIFYGTKGGISLAPLTIYREESNILSEITPQFEKNDPISEQFHHFFTCLKTKKATLVDGDQGLQVLEMIQHIYQSAKKKEEIKLT